jgi:hypothetical protein
MHIRCLWVAQIGRACYSEGLELLILWKADTDVLALASKTDSIDRFLQQVPSDTLEWIKFFKNRGHEDTLYFLRDVVWDCVPPPDFSTVTVLGERSTTDNKTRRNTVEAWYILDRYFPDYSQ